MPFLLSFSFFYEKMAADKVECKTYFSLMQERRKQRRSRGPSLSSFSRTRANASKPKILPPTSHHSSGKQVKGSSPGTYSQIFINTCTVLYLYYYRYNCIICTLYSTVYLHTYLDCVIYVSYVSLSFAKTFPENRLPRNQVLI